MVESTNKAWGLVLGVVVGLVWIYTDPNSDISSTMLVGLRIITF